MIEEESEQQDQRLYELALHIIPGLELAGVASQIETIEGIVKSAGGTIMSSHEPRRMHLSYPLSHKHYAYFYVADLQMPGDTLGTLDSQLKLQTQVLRFLITKKLLAPNKVKALTLARMTRTKTGSGSTRQKSDDFSRRKPATAEEHKQIESELDKALAKI